MKKVDLKSNKIHKLKNFIITNKKEIIVILLVFALLTYMFFQFRLFVTYDSSKYYEYMGFFTGKYPISQWDPVRGPIYPFIIFIFTSLFGNNHFGVLFGNYLIYIGMMIMAYIIMKKLFKDIYKKDIPIYLWILFIVLFVFNPIMIGYQHLMLTESVIPIVLFASSLLCINFYSMKFSDNRKKYIIISIVLCVLSAIAYFIKQPFAPIVWISIFITAVLSAIYLKSWKEFGIKVLIFVCSMFFTFVSLMCWNGVIRLNDRNDVNNSASAMTARGIISMEYNFKREEKNSFCNDRFLSNHYLESNDYNIIKNNMNDNNWCDKIEVYNVYNRKLEYVRTEVLFKKNKEVGLFESIGFLFKLWFKYPIYAMQSYYQSYLTITDLQNIADKFGDYTPVAGISDDVKRENNDLALIIYHKGYNNVYWDTNSDEPVFPNALKINPHKDMKSFETKTSDNEDASVIMRLLSPTANTLFKFLMTFSFVFMIYSFIKFIMYKNVNYFVMTLFSGMAFTNIMFNVLFGANIDRYVYPTYIFMILVLILCFADKREYNKRKVKK